MYTQVHLKDGIRYQYNHQKVDRCCHNRALHLDRMIIFIWNIHLRLMKNFTMANKYVCAFVFRWLIVKQNWIIRFHFCQIVVSIAIVEKKHQLELKYSILSFLFLLLLTLSKSSLYFYSIIYLSRDCVFFVLSRLYIYTHLSWFCLLVG